eukprot:scpid37874/ scgid31246/ 
MTLCPSLPLAPALCFYQTTRMQKLLPRRSAMQLTTVWLLTLTPVLMMMEWGKKRTGDDDAGNYCISTAAISLFRAYSRDLSLALWVRLGCACMCVSVCACVYVGACTCVCACVCVQHVTVRHLAIAAVSCQ